MVTVNAQKNANLNVKQNEQFLLREGKKNSDCLRLEIESQFSKLCAHRLVNPVHTFTQDGRVSSQLTPSSHQAC